MKIRVVASVARQKREVQFSKISWEERALDDSIQCLMEVVAYNHIVGICCASRRGYLGGIKQCLIIVETVQMSPNSSPSTKTLDHIVHLTPPGTFHDTAEQFRQLGFKFGYFFINKIVDR